MREFRVDWSAADVGAVLDRVRTTRLPPSLPGAGWTLGCDADFLRGLAEHWTERYDWRAAVDDLNRYPQFIADIDGLDIHFVHVLGESQGRNPLLLTHGWPGSHYEFWQVVEPLTHPSRHGGSAADAFDLVIPSLPGYGFSGKPSKLIDTRETARVWHKLMTERLGYRRFRAQGGDWGSTVTSWLGADFAASLDSIHLNMTPFWPEDEVQTPEEHAWAGGLWQSYAQNSAYVELQATRPQSLAWAAAGSPLGQASWIIERFHDWADLGGGELESLFSLDQLLTNVMIYVMTESFGSSAWYYAAARQGAGFKANQRCDTPTYVSAFPDRVYPPPPRSLVERAYNLKDWSRPARGGHFAAMEQPKIFVQELQRWNAATRNSQGDA